jgi:hypothetical protein
LAATATIAAHYAAGDGPRSVAIGDFDKDGKSDLVVANVNSDNLSVLLNRTSTIDGMVWSDVDADGIQDGGEPGAAGVVAEVFQSYDDTVGNADDVSRGVAITNAVAAKRLNFGVRWLGVLQETRAQRVILPAKCGHPCVTMDCAAIAASPRASAQRPKSILGNWFFVADPEVGLPNHKEGVLDQTGPGLEKSRFRAQRYCSPLTMAHPRLARSQRRRRFRPARHRWLRAKRDNGNRERDSTFLADRPAIATNNAETASLIKT